MLKKRKSEEKEKNLIKLAGILQGKNAFALKISENLAKYRSKNNLVTHQNIIITHVGF